MSAKAPTGRATADADDPRSPARRRLDKHLAELEERRAPLLKERAAIAEKLDKLGATISSAERQISELEIDEFEASRSKRRRERSDR